MPYANPPQMLAIFIQRQLPRGNVNYASCIAICKKIDKVIHNGMTEKDIAAFKKVLEKSLKRAPTYIKYACLNGLKNYLHSRDFQHSKKYEKKTKWLIFTEVSETELLNPIYSCIDELIKKNKPTEQIPPVSVSTTKIKAGLSSLSIPFTLLAATRTPLTTASSSLPDFNQSPVLPRPSSFDIAAKGSCLPVDELPLYYHILQNVPLSEVTHFFLGETHTNKTHIDRKTKSALSIGNPGDYIRAEGADYGQDTIECSIVDLPEVFHCGGWEDPAARKWADDNIIPLLNLYETFPESYSQLYMFFDYQMSLFNKATNIADKQALIDSLIDALNAMWPTYIANDKDIIELEVNNLQKIKALNRAVKTKKDYNSLNTLIHQSLNRLGNTPLRIQQALGKVHDDSILITARNVGLEESIKELEKENDQRAKKGEKLAKQIYFGGMLHFFPQRACEDNAAITNQKHFHSVTSQDPQFQFRVAASRVPSAILYPR